MAEMNISVGGRRYAMHCRDGDEPRIRELAAQIDARVEKVKKSSPGLTEVRQLLFAALLLADELQEAESEKAAALTQAAQATGTADDSEQQAHVHALERLAERLEALGEGLAAATGTA